MGFSFPEPSSPRRVKDVSDGFFYSLACTTIVVLDCLKAGALDMRIDLHGVETVILPLYSNLI